MKTVPNPFSAGLSAESKAKNFVDRRDAGQVSVKDERRQFANTYAGLSPNARELAEAIDRYKARNRRRYITFEEMLQVITQLGYTKQS